MGIFDGLKKAEFFRLPDGEYPVLVTGLSRTVNGGFAFQTLTVGEGELKTLPEDGEPFLIPDGFRLRAFWSLSSPDAAAYAKKFLIEPLFGSTEAFEDLANKLGDDQGRFVLEEPIHALATVICDSKGSNKIRSFKPMAGWAGTDQDNDFTSGLGES